MADPALEPQYAVPGPQNLDDWLEQNAEPPVDPDLPIIDCHHHLIGSYKPFGSRAKNERRPPAGAPTLTQVVWSGVRSSGPYLAEELLEDIATGGHRVLATVFAECTMFFDADSPPGSSAWGRRGRASGSRTRSPRAARPTSW